MWQLLLDAVGAPVWAFHGWFISIILSPFLFAGGVILFFRFLDWYSNRKEAKK